MRGATKIVIFTGIMNAVRYGQILEASLLPFIDECYPDGHRLQQDNDLEHTSRYIQRISQRRMYFGGRHHLNLLISIRLRTYGNPLNSF